MSLCRKFAETSHEVLIEVVDFDFLVHFVAVVELKEIETLVRVVLIVSPEAERACYRPILLDRVSKGIGSALFKIEEVEASASVEHVVRRRRCGWDLNNAYAGYGM